MGCTLAKINKKEEDVVLQEKNKSKKKNLLGDDGVLDLAELEAHEASTRLQNSVGLLEDTVNVGAVTDSESNRIGVHRVIGNMLQVLCVTLHERYLGGYS